MLCGNRYRLNQPEVAIAADFAAGSEHWTSLLLRYLSLVNAVEPSTGTLLVLNNTFSNEANVKVFKESIGEIEVPPGVRDEIETLNTGVYFIFKYASKELRKLRF